MSNASYCNGRSAQQHAIQVSVRDGVLHWQSLHLNDSCELNLARLAPPMGTLDAMIHLPDGGVIQVHDAAVIQAWPKRTTWVDRCAERAQRHVAALVMVMCLGAGTVYACMKWGIPMVSTALVSIIPEQVDREIGEQGLNSLDRLVFKPSQLSLARQVALHAKWEKYCQANSCPEHKLLFREGRQIGANALALPGGTMVLTDELVLLATQDEELMTVLAHELGHVQGRHGARMALQTLGSAALLMAVTGDFGNMTDLASSLPALLLQSGYARDMEREADAYALTWMQERCIAPQHLSNILQHLDHRKDKETDWLDSHPGMQERMQMFSVKSAC